MKGDFSKLRSDPYDNYTGVLHQQGRVLLDQDWNAAAQIAGHQHRAMGRDTIGPGVAAVPAEMPDSFKVIRAETDGRTVRVTLNPGRVWIDGLMLLVKERPSALSLAYVLPPASAANITAGTRDAVIVEVWQETVSAFQYPLELLEPALGGPDTTERIKLFHRVALLRLGTGADCDDVPTVLASLTTPRGRLTVTPADTLEIEGECPVEIGGGYTGLEHYLYRIEITEPDGGAHARFKWSRFGGGLVGRGSLDTSGATPKVRITANDQMINHCGLTSFCLEALQEGTDGGPWEITFTADATLSADGELSLANRQGTWPAGDDAFFRLWDGVRLVSDFPTGLETPNELENGLRLEFDAPTTGNANYTPGDYWTFPVRAGNVDYEALDWPDNAEPQGIHRHRASLGVLKWTAAPSTAVEVPDDIDDCRHVFSPLADLSPCPCIRVDPGESIHHAVNQVLAQGGGCICLMPGNHVLTEPIDLTRRAGVRIHGFGRVSRLLVSPRLGDRAPFVLAGCRDITFDSFAVVGRGTTPTWVCTNADNVAITNMAASTTLATAKFPIVQIAGKSCRRFRLEGNSFLSPMGVAGTILSDSTISGNTFQGTARGIEMDYLLNVTIENNRFTGVRSEVIAKDQATVEEMRTSKATMDSHMTYVGTAPKEPATRQDILAGYLPVKAAGVFEAKIAHNRFEGSLGVVIELLENCAVTDNDFLTPVAGAYIGLAHGLKFAGNRLGTEAAATTKSIRCAVGLAIVGDAVDCQVRDNAFANVKEGIVFESDLSGQKMAVREFADSLLAAEKAPSKRVAGQMFAEAQTRAGDNLSQWSLGKSTYFKIGRCERTLIEGNRFNAARLAIEWSGTKNIVDFRIVNNAISGCQDVAIQIEPDERMFYLADPVDTKVRLIEKNRFEVYSGGVRATIGAVRVEMNDIRVLPAPKATAKAGDVLVMAADHVYRKAPLSSAVKESDVPMTRLMMADSMNAIEKNPETVDVVSFGKAANDFGKTYKPQQEDVLADTVYVAKVLAEAGAYGYVAGIVNAAVPALTVNAEGYAVNLAGLQNRAVHNRIYVTNNDHPGGIIFQAISGEVRDNEVNTPGIALLLSGKAGLSAGYDGVEIGSNSLSTTGIPGSESPVYALAIPSLSPGSLSITGNLFKGSVMVGGDPVTAQGLVKKAGYTSKEAVAYSAVKYDMATYAIAGAGKTFAKAAGIVEAVLPDVLAQAWVTDPHAQRPVVQFADNRVIKGWVGIFQALSGAYWPPDLLKKQASQALVAAVSANIIDYGGSVVGQDVILTGNHSQLALRYRVGRKMEAAANIPAPTSI